MMKHKNNEKFFGEQHRIRQSERDVYTGELSDDQLDKVSGGTEVVKLGKITVEGKREPVKLDKIVVNEKRTKTS
jgi:hypothetical protein